MANRIMLNQTSYHGAGAIEEIVNEAKAHAFQKAFVCSDPDLIKFGVTGKVTGLLDKEGLAYEIYSDIKANPTIDNVKNGVAAFKASGADYIIAIGGGSSMGNYVMLDHGGGLYTIYMHASALYVSKDDIVVRGETIAAVGSTGRSTGNHLHFSVRKDGAYTSPWNYLSQ